MHNFIDARADNNFHPSKVVVLQLGNWNMVFWVGEKGEIGKNVNKDLLISTLAGASAEASADVSSDILFTSIAF